MKTKILLLPINYFNKQYHAENVEGDRYMGIETFNNRIKDLINDYCGNINDEEKEKVFNSIQIYSLHDFMSLCNNGELFNLDDFWVSYIIVDEL